MILLVNSSCSSLKHNHHLINHRIIYKESKYLTELYYFAQERSVNVVLWVTIVLESRACASVNDETQTLMFCCLFKDSNCRVADTVMISLSVLAHACVL